MQLPWFRRRIAFDTAANPRPPSHRQQLPFLSAPPPHPLSSQLSSQLRQSNSRGCLCAATNVALI